MKVKYMGMFCETICFFDETRKQEFFEMEEQRYPIQKDYQKRPNSYLYLQFEK